MKNEYVSNAFDLVTGDIMQIASLSSASSPSKPENEQQAQDHVDAGIPENNLISLYDPLHNMTI
jgi:hypothetical protein